MDDIIKNERGTYEFSKDKVLGDKGEDMFIKFLEGKGFTNILKNTQLGLENLKLWDIESWCNGKRFTFEVKTDARAADTGNLCIEHSRTGLDGRTIPSGVSVTTADFFVSIIPDLREIRIIYTKELVGIIEREKDSLFSVPMGDNGRTQGYLMKIKKYEKYYRAVRKV